MDIRLSSYKRGHGVEELFSKDIQNYWATDDLLPHGIQFTFNKLTYIEEVRIYLSYAQDDSYTPQEIEVRCGLVESEINPITNMTLVEPEGFFSLSVKEECFYLQIIILSNHQDGKDSHVRHLKLMESKTKELFINI